MRKAMQCQIFDRMFADYCPVWDCSGPVRDGRLESTTTRNADGVFVFGHRAKDGSAIGHPG